MQYRRMPKNGDMVSILGFGCMRLPMTDGKIDEKRAISQIRYAIDHGVNYLDTAWPYHGGASEPLLARVLKDGYRDRVKVATKLPTWKIKCRADMDSYLNAQLEKLSTDHIDYYLMHALTGPSWETIKGLGAIGFLDKAIADGRIVNAGFSFHGLPEAFTRIVDDYSWDFCQIQYNFLDQKNQAGTEGLKYAASKKLGVIVMEPLRGGNLGLATPPPAVQLIWDESQSGRTAAEWALRWVWNHPEVTVVLSGMNEEAHVKENIATADTAYADSMSKEELQLVERVSQKYLELLKVNCTGCGYCMPCPSDVLIPGCFELYNKMHMFGDENGVKFFYVARMAGLVSNGSPTFASQCVECGECLEKCPQHILIPEVLAKVAEEMEGPDMAERLVAAKKFFQEDNQ
jgi:predicted aldo/keto reductase-like oxidoreductase